MVKCKLKYNVNYEAIICIPSSRMQILVYIMYRWFS